MSHGVQDLLVLLVFLAGSFLTPVLAKRIRMPAAVLLIGFGVLLGPAALALKHNARIIEFLFEVGFIVLMFLAGLEIDFGAIRRKGGRALLLVVVICAGIFALSFLCSWAMGLHPIFGLALGATSVGLPLAILKETGQLRSGLGQQILLLGSVGEFLSVIGMTLFYFISKYGVSVQLLIGLAKLGGLLLVAGLTLRAFMAMAWWQPERFNTLVDAHEESEIGVRASLFMMMAFSLLCLVAGLEAIVGAFVAGALLAFVLRGKEILEQKLAVVGHGLFVPIFFIEVGLRFDLSAITVASLLFAGQLVLAAFTVRLLPCLLLLRQGSTVREMLGTVSLLSAPLTLVVAIAALGMEVGAVTPEGKSTLIVLAVASGTIFPILFRALAPAPAAEAPPSPR
ncbi:MAG: cation:proton antiporter [bacterium]